MWSPGSDRRVERVPSKGLTLLEVLISLVIISTALVGLVGLENQNIRAIDVSRRMTTAAMLARNMMTQIELAGFTEDLGEEEGDFLEEETDEDAKVGLAGFRWKRSIEAARFGGMTYEHARKVKVTIIWNEGKRERHLDVVTYLARRGEET